MTWVMEGDAMEESLLQELARGLEFSEKGLQVFEDNLAWNIATDAEEFKGSINQIFEK